MNFDVLDREDYVEPQCPFCTDTWKKDKPVHSIDIRRVIEKLDSFLAKNDDINAEKLLIYWLKEAENGNDLRGAITVSSELMGLYRKRGDNEKAVYYADYALNAVKEAGLEDTLTEATTCINAGTVFKAAGDSQKAMPYYRRAETIFRNENDVPLIKRGGLYNNMALALADIKEYGEAKTYFIRAIETMGSVENCECQCAISYLNLADVIYLEKGIEAGFEEIEECLDKAETLIDSSSLRDGEYAFSISKCAPVFDYYGRFAYARELKERAEKIYEGN